MDGSSAVLEHEGRKERLERFGCGDGRNETRKGFRNLALKSRRGGTGPLEPVCPQTALGATPAVFPPISFLLTQLKFGSALLRGH